MPRSRINPTQYYNDKKPKTDALKAENISFDKNDPLELKLLLFCLRHKQISLYVQLVLVVINISAFVYSVRGKFLLYSQIKGFHNNVVAVTNSLSDFLLLALNAFGIMDVTKTSFFVELFYFILKKRTAPVKQKHISFTRYIQMLRFLALIPIVTNTYFFVSQVGWNVKQYFIPRDIWYYVQNLLVCSTVNLTRKIKEAYDAINDDLEQLLKSDAISFIVAEFPTSLQFNVDHPLKTRNKLEQLRDLSSNYTILCNLLDTYNRYSKRYLALILMNIIMNILLNVTVIVEFAVKSDILGDEAKTSVFVAQAMLAIVSIGQAAGAAFVGEILEEEGERTSRICYTFLNKLNRNVKTDYDKQLIKEVKFLLDQSKSRKIYLYAGGFFKLNWSLLGSIISTVATYSIVIIQFVLK